MNIGIIYLISISVLKNQLSWNRCATIRNAALRFETLRFDLKRCATISTLWFGSLRCAVLSSDRYICYNFGGRDILYKLRPFFNIFFKKTRRFCTNVQKFLICKKARPHPQQTYLRLFTFFGHQNWTDVKISQYVFFPRFWFVYLRGNERNPTHVQYFLCTYLIMPKLC